MMNCRFLVSIGFIAFVVAPFSSIAETGRQESECGEVSPKQVLSQCSLCHSMAETSRKMAGPSLYGIFGRKAGVDEGYQYSAAFAEANFVWNHEILNAFLEEPRAVVPKNKMAFSRISNPQRREAVICALKGLGHADSPTPGESPASFIVEDEENEE